MPAASSVGWSGSANERYVISWRRARCRIRCHVRSLPPLSSGSSRSDFSHNIRMGEGLDSFAIDERAVPELEVEERPQPVAAVGAAGRMTTQERVHRGRIDDAALARAAIEEDVAHDPV